MTTPNAGENLKSYEMRKDKSVNSVVEDLKDVLENEKSESLKENNHIQANHKASKENLA